MAVGPEELVELKSGKIQLEVGLIYLKRKRAEMEKQQALLQKEPRSSEGAARLTQLRAELEEVAREIAAREETIRQIVERIGQAERTVQEEGVEELLQLNDSAASDLAALRTEILKGLRALADPLRRYQEIADRKTRLVRRLGTISDRDLSYPNYLDCALFRQDEHDDALRYVLEVLKRQRVVA